MRMRMGGGVVQGLHHNNVLKRRVGLYHTTSCSPLNSQPTSPTNEHSSEQNCSIHKKLFIFNSRMVFPSKSKLLKKLVGIHTEKRNLNNLMNTSLSIFNAFNLNNYFKDTNYIILISNLVCVSPS